MKNQLLGRKYDTPESTLQAQPRDTRKSEAYNLEGFYRFPLFPGLDTRVSYEYVIDPAFTREFDNASVFSLGFRTVF
jgi:hypothetical protein